MATYVITGANRGIGYAIAKQLAAEGNKVIGTARNPSQATDLAAIPGVKVVALDVTDPESQKAAAAEVSKLTGGAIDVLILNAGYYSDTLSLDFEAYPTETRDGRGPGPNREDRRFSVLVRFGPGTNDRTETGRCQK